MVGRQLHQGRRQAPVALSEEAPSVHTLCYSDARAYGWGGLLGQPRLDGGTDFARGSFTPAEQAGSSTLREALALLNTLRSRPGLGGKTIRAVVDNQGLECGWYGGSATPVINAVLTDTWQWCHSVGSILAVLWVPRAQNARVDAVSKFVDRDDWQLHPEVFAALDRRWGPHTFDRFASTSNALCPRFSSLMWCPDTAGIDAFSFDWAQDNCWVNAPFPLIPSVFFHLRECAACATVICPHWPSRPWWHLICPDGTTLAPYIVDWAELPSRPDLFLPGHLLATRQASAGRSGACSPCASIFLLLPCCRLASRRKLP